MIDFPKPLFLLVCSEGVKLNFENGRNQDKYIKLVTEELANLCVIGALPNILSAMLENIKVQAKELRDGLVST
jgi:hypothetical protein